MISLQTFFGFSLAAFLLALAPGPDNIFVLTQSVLRGAKVGVALTVGLCSGIIVHTTAATLGISIIFDTSEIAFMLLKFAGAIYLFYLAYQAFKYRNEALNLEKNSKFDHLNTKKLIIRGFFMNVLNPKVALFFLAFLPQFVKAEAGSIPLQMIQLGLVFMFWTYVVFLSIAFFAHKASTKLRENKNISKIANISTSFIFLAIGLKLVFTQK